MRGEGSSMSAVNPLLLFCLVPASLLIIPDAISQLSRSCPVIPALPTHIPVARSLTSKKARDFLQTVIICQDIEGYICVSNVSLGDTLFVC